MLFIVSKYIYFVYHFKIYEILENSDFVKSFVVTYYIDFDILHIFYK